MARDNSTLFSSSSSSRHDLRSQFIAATTGSFVATLALNPVTVVKIRLQSKSQTGSVLSIVRSVYSKNGIGGYWCGARAGLMQGIPSTVVYMTTYESYKRWFTSMIYPESSLYSAIPAIAAGDHMYDIYLIFFFLSHLYLVCVMFRNCPSCICDGDVTVRTSTYFAIQSIGCWC